MMSKIPPRPTPVAMATKFETKYQSCIKYSTSKYQYQYQYMRLKYQYQWSKYQYKYQ